MSFKEKIIAELSNETPGARWCVLCKKDFFVYNTDLDFYRKFLVPVPKKCPSCREQSRLVFQNMLTLYRRSCQTPGHSEMVLSTIPEESFATVYDSDYYYGDTWEATEFGISLEPKNFFTLFQKLAKTVPWPALRKDTASVNCDYAIYGGGSKNVYYSSSVWNSEDILFSQNLFKSKSCTDCYRVNTCDTCYNCAFLNDSFKIQYGYYSSNCLESMFIYDCHNSSHCFGCVNIRNGSYYFFNQKLSKEEYEAKLSQINLSNIHVVRQYEKLFWDLVRKESHRGVHIEHSTDVTGTMIFDSNNIFKSGMIEHCQDVWYSNTIVRSKQIMDVNGCGKSEGLYYSIASGGGSANLKFCYATKSSRDSEYLMNCTNCVNCFGCVGLKNKSFYILNMPYSEQDYFSKVDLVKQEMLRGGSYGEFFDLSLSPFPYNATIAPQEYPLSDQEIISRGGFIVAPTLPNTVGQEIIQAILLPDEIRHVDDSILQKVIIGEDDVPFRITQTELTYYRMCNIPLPRNSPYSRLSERYKKFGHFVVHDINCTSCGKITPSSFNEREYSRILCRECYLREVV